MISSLFSKKERYGDNPLLTRARESVANLENIDSKKLCVLTYRKARLGLERVKSAEGQDGMLSISELEWRIVYFTEHGFRFEKMQAVFRERTKIEGKRWKMCLHLFCLPLDFFKSS